MQITYLFDPLCGWCYGARPALEKLSHADGVVLRLAPTGLFADQNARPIDPAFAAFAWSNDQRIAHLTGQVFSDAYRTLLDTPGAIFDSGPTTRGLVAIGMTQPDREPAALKMLQNARYVDGRNTADPAVVADVLAGAGFADAARLLSSKNAALRQAYAGRVDAARRLMTHFGARGVPALVVGNERGGRLVQGNILYEDPDTLTARLEAA